MQPWLYARVAFANRCFCGVSCWYTRNRLGKLKRMRPSAFRSPGGWKMRIDPSLLRPICKPRRDSAPGSRASAGIYSLRMIDGGTFQVGLTVMYFIVSVSKGVEYSPGLPTTIRVVHAVAPLWTTLSV